MMCVDEEVRDPDIDQLIERESDERPLKDWNEWLGEVVREWTQARAQPCA